MNMSALSPSGPLALGRPVLVDMVRSTALPAFLRLLTTSI